MSSIKNRQTKAIRAAVREAMRTGNHTQLVEYLKSNDDILLPSQLIKAVHKIERLREFPVGTGMTILSHIIADAEKDSELKSKLYPVACS